MGREQFPRDSTMLHIWPSVTRLHCVPICNIVRQCGSLISHFLPSSLPPLSCFTSQPHLSQTQLKKSKEFTITASIISSCLVLGNQHITPAIHYCTVHSVFALMISCVYLCGHNNAALISLTVIASHVTGDT